MTSLLFGECGCCQQPCNECGQPYASDVRSAQKRIEGWRPFDTGGATVAACATLYRTRRIVVTGRYVQTDRVTASDRGPYSYNGSVTIRLTDGQPIATLSETTAPTPSPGFEMLVSVPFGSGNFGLQYMSPTPDLGNATRVRWTGTTVITGVTYPWTFELLNEDASDLSEQIDSVDELLARLDFRPVEPIPSGNTFQGARYKNVYVPLQSGVGAIGNHPTGRPFWNFPDGIIRAPWEGIVLPDEETETVPALGFETALIAFSELTVSSLSGSITKTKGRHWPKTVRFCSKRNSEEILANGNFSNATNRTYSTVELTNACLAYDSGPFRFCRLRPECETPTGDCGAPDYVGGCVGGSTVSYVERQQIVPGNQSAEETYHFRDVVWPVPSDGRLFLGYWDATNNQPHLFNEIGENNSFYLVRVAGTTQLGIGKNWLVGDAAIFLNSTTGWAKDTATDEGGFQGYWNADTNVPNLDDIGTPGIFYRVSVAGRKRMADGTINWQVGDRVKFFNLGATWNLIPRETAPKINSFAVFVPGDATLVEFKLVPNGRTELPFPCEDFTIRQRYGTPPIPSVWDDESDSCEMIYRRTNPAPGEFPLVTSLGIFYYFQIADGVSALFDIQIRVQAPCVIDETPCL